MIAGIMLVGAGRVGLNLAVHILRRGLPLALVIEASADRRDALSESLAASRADVPVRDSIPGRIPADVTYCALSVPDGRVADVARELATRPDLPSGLVVFHTSGNLSSEVLAPLADRGCLTGCLHPMQSFPEQVLAPGLLDGIGCGIEGSDVFWTEARTFATTLGWQPLRIAAEHKALYHAANVFAGNFPVALALAAERLLRASAVDGSTASLDLLLPMMRTVVDRLDGVRPSDALTGPAARGDLDTIARHLEALDTIDPALRTAYAALTEWLIADG